MIGSFRYKKLSLFGSFFALLVLSSVVSTVVQTPKTKAAYDGGNLIANSVFLNSNSMSKSDIQSFLVGRGAGIANMSFVLDCDLAGSQAKQMYQSIGAPCGQSAPASDIIYFASQIYGINPKVILVTMQKEQSLTTAANPTSWQLNQAMGYGCPTSGGCGASTFFYQIDNGAWVLRFHFERARNNMNWWYTSNSWTCGTEKAYYKPNLYPSQNVNFYDQDNVYYRTHFIANAATSSMYCYTPHAYNNPSGLYGLPAYGNTGRYYTGSYNFVKFFELWFGSTQGDRPVLTNTTHPDGTLIQEGGRNEVYMIINQVRHHVKGLDVFNSHNYKWSEVRLATLKDLTLDISDDPITYRSGNLVRGSSDNKIFYIRCSVTACTKYHIFDLATFNGLGYNSGQVITIPQSEANAMTEGTAINSALAHPQDSVVLNPANGKVYVIGAGHKHWVPSLAIFTANRYNWGLVETATAADLALPESTIGFAEGALVRSPNGPAVYAIDQDQHGNYSKRFITSQTVFAGLGYSPHDVLVDPNLPGPNGPDITE